ncbi:iron uptake system protein EfeO [Janibacter sp. UYMM211]|uniref:iron uptake system protein EfeO n=1 Tax=Janibacter sp. UYMM211 TaxID=3156342 RepID=UPI003394FF34
MRRTVTTTALGLSAALALAACGGDAKDASAGGGPIAVTASDTECSLARAEAPAGTVEFEVKNTGSKVNEFYVYAEGDRIVGEVENIAPGLSRTFHVTVSEPGTYVTACKPGMVGAGIRSDFTITGASAAPKSQDEQLVAATDGYERYVASQADAFETETGKFVAAVKKGDVAQAKRLYPTARSYWERIEPVAESFGDLDPKIDGRADVLDEGMKFTGYHRLERDLWKTGLQDDSDAIADQLKSDVAELVTKAKAVELDPLQLANGSKALLDEMATGKITGEEERYSHTDLYDFAANFEGSKSAISSLRPYLKKADADLVTSIDKKTKALDTVLQQHATADGWALYTDLSDAEVKELSDALDALSEDVAKVAGVVADGQ